ncbi:MAG: cobalamin-independent methionine synthase II family protein [Chloroflexota bacterium]|nr:cobalamin-independent methionine synthase II family protein [Chloroflexota bacterium]
MKRSHEKILTTHTGSLPRSTQLQDLLKSQLQPTEHDQDNFENTVAAEVYEIVNRQVTTGIDIINDGEQGRVQYVSYVKDRLTGFEGEHVVRNSPRLDDLDFPEFFSQRGTSSTSIPMPACTSPIGWKDKDAIKRDIQRLLNATAAVQATEVFMTAASPGAIATFLPNEYYPTEEEYLYALADTMREDYKQIVDAGLLLQIDCPDLAMTRVSQFSHLSETEFVKIVEMHVEVLEYALAEIPPDKTRMHMCWGNTEGPHNHDIPLEKIINTVLKAPPTAISFEAANPRHAHEWQIWKTVQLPEGKVIIPGVLDTTTNFIEHPLLVAERIIRFAQAVGKENVIAGSDCGFGTSAWGRRVETNIAWAKLASMVEGAEIASRELWH